MRKHLADALLARIASDIEAGLTGGMQILVAHRGEILVDEVAGERHDRQPVDRDTIFCWFSSSKAVTAVAVAQLVERGLLAYDDLLVRYLPELATADGKEQITLLHALTHRAGMPDFEMSVPFTSYAPGGDWLERVAALPLLFPPGVASVYHPIAVWALIGELIHRVDGRPFEQVCREEIFEPAAMTSSSFGLPAEQRPRFSDLWAPEGDETIAAVRAGWAPMFDVVAPAGSLMATGADVMRFYLALDQLLSPASLETLTTRQVNHVECDWGFGMGVMVGPEPRFGSLASARCFGHPGWVTTTAFHEPSRDLTFVAAGNGTPEQDVADARFSALSDIAHRAVDPTIPDSEETPSR